jgi:hypothetical protein
MFVKNKKAKKAVICLMSEVLGLDLQIAMHLRPEIIIIMI